MIRGLYTAGAGMLMNDRRMQTIDENIENIRTPGYREASESVIPFPQYLMKRIDHDTGVARSTVLGVMGTGSYVNDMLYKDSQGLMRETGNTTDMAINGDGFFVVLTPQGERYTRNGHLMRDPNGFLRTVGGNPVLGTNGPIGPVPEDFAVTADGWIIDNTTGEEIAQLRLVTIPGDSLGRVGKTTMYSAKTPPVELTGDARPRIEQGFIEEANVDVSAQMVKMIEVNRSFAANQRMIQTNDQLMQKSANEIGKIL